MIAKNVWSFVLLITAGGTARSAEEPPILTVCEALKDPGRYDGKTVIIVGRAVGTSEGTWLREDCGLTITNADHEFEPMISTASLVSREEPPPQLPRHFHWNRPLVRQKLDEVKRTTHLSDPNDTWVAAFGRLETKLPWHLKFGDRDGLVFGFGHLGAAPAQLIGPHHGYITLQ